MAIVGVLAAFATGTHGMFSARGSAEPELLCDGYTGVPGARSGTAGMVLVSGGRFVMGPSKFHPEERPECIETVGSCWIDRTEATNAQFAAFVEATRYVTVVERQPDASKYPGARADLLKPGSIVFTKPDGKVDLSDITRCWHYAPGASWRHPEGPESTWKGRENHPVVHVAYEDALAYARWRGNELPTEAAWEHAARDGLEGKIYTWGDEKVPEGRWQASTWQGVLLLTNKLADGYEGTAPVGCFPANDYGLFDMAGNVWEINEDDYRDLRGSQPGMKVVKGGPHLCADNFCYRYRPASRQPASTDVGTSHIGFRTVRRIP